MPGIIGIHECEDHDAGGAGCRPPMVYCARHAAPRVRPERTGQLLAAGRSRQRGWAQTLDWPAMHYGTAARTARPLTIHAASLSPLPASHTPLAARPPRLGRERHPARGGSDRGRRAGAIRVARMVPDARGRDRRPIAPWAPWDLSAMQDTIKQPRVSVVITTYNYERFIAAAIESVLGQTVRPDEIVVVDDGSTDGTAAVVARYAAQGVRYIRQANAGAGAARNRGIRETRGDLLAFLDADDRWRPDKLARQLAHLRRYPAAGLVTGGEWQVFGAGRPPVRVRRPPARAARLYPRILIENLIG